MSEVDTEVAPATPAAEPAAPSSGREAAEAAYDAVAAEEAPESQGPPSSDTNTAATAEAAVAQAEFQRARDEQGRFTKQPEQAKATPTPVPKVGQPTPTPVPKASAPTPTEPSKQELKAPGGWSPMAREKWASLPPEVQSEVHRRERETAITLQRIGPIAKVGQAFQEMVRPYEGLMRAQGAEPMAAVAGVLQSYATLTMGPMDQRVAQLVRIYKHSGVPLEMLDSALAGEMPKAQAQNFDPVAFEQQLFQKWNEQQQVQRAQSMVDYEASQLDAWLEKLEFMDSVSPGGHRVSDDMADMMELAARRGVALSHEDAYHRALQLPQHKGILEVIQQRAAKDERARKQAEADKAKAAGSSPLGQPTGSPQGKPNGQWKDPRDAAVAAWELHAQE